MSPKHPAPDLDRFLPHLDALRGHLDRAAAEAADDNGPETLFAHRLYRAGARTPAFMLQGLARVYRKLDLKDLPVDLFDRLRLETKIVEDVLGQVDFWWGVRQRALDHKLPKAVVGWAEQRHAQACGEARTWLLAREWLVHRYIAEPERFVGRADRLARRLRKTDWPSPRRFRAALGRFLVDELTAVEAGLSALDLADIEHGLHECRRRVRWFSVYAAAASGAVALDRDAPAPPDWARYLTPETVESPFNQLPAPEPDLHPVVLPAPLFYALSYLIDRLGQLKDRAQWTSALQAGLLATGAGKGKPAAAWLGEAALESAEAARQAAAVVEQVLRQDRLLPRLAEAVAAQA